MALSVADFLADVRRRAMIGNQPSGGNQNANLLAFADTEMRSRVVPAILALNQDYLTRYVDVALGANETGIRIPKRAQGAKLIDVWWVDNSGNITPLTRVNLADVANYNYSPSVGPANGFYLEGNFLRLLGQQSTQGSIRMSYVARPSKLTEATDVTSREILTATVGSTNVDLTFASLTASSQDWDILGADTFDLLGEKNASFAGMTSWSVNRAAFAPAINSSALVGGIVVQSGKTPYVQLTSDWADYLVQRTVCRALQAMGDANGQAIAEQDAAAILAALQTQNAARVDNRPQYVTGGLYWQVGGMYNVW